MKYTLNIKLVKRLTLSLILVVFFLVLSPGISQAQEVTHFCPASASVGPTACEAQCTNIGLEVESNVIVINQNSGTISGYQVTCTGDFESIPPPQPASTEPVDTSATGEFVPLVGIPGIEADAEFGEYVNALYALSISLAALLAVIKIIIAGIKWMLSDMVSTISDAKNDIQGALVGLLIIISAVVVLNFINPQLTQTNLFSGTAVNTSGSGPSSGSNPGAVADEPSIQYCNYSVSICADYEARCTGAGGTATRVDPAPGTGNFGLGTTGSVTCSKPFGPVTTPPPPITTPTGPAGTEIISLACNTPANENPDPCFGAITACEINQRHISTARSFDAAGNNIILCTVRAR